MTAKNNTQGDSPVILAEAVPAEAVPAEAVPAEAVLAEEPALAAADSTAPKRWIDRRAVAYAGLYCMGLALALPVLWFSRGFTLKEKLIHTGCTLVATIAFVWLMWFTWHHSVIPIWNFFTT